MIVATSTIRLLSLVPAPKVRSDIVPSASAAKAKLVAAKDTFVPLCSPGQIEGCTACEFVEYPAQSSALLHGVLGQEIMVRLLVIFVEIDFRYR